MNVEFVDSVVGDAIIWCVFEGKEGAPEFDPGLSPEARHSIERVISAMRFSGAPGQVVGLLAPAFCDAEQIVLLGLGAPDRLDALAWQHAGGHAVRHLLTSGARDVCFVGAVDPDAAAQIALGASLAAYRFDQYRSELDADKKPSLRSVAIVQNDVAAAQAAYAALAPVAEGVSLARDLVSEPPNILHPESFAARIADLAQPGLNIELVDEAALAGLDMNAMLAVGRGSAHASMMCILRWTGAEDPAAPPLVLIGKGLTFDAGGISIKPAANMEAMKGDMAGAAAVVGAMSALAGRKARANVIGIVGLVENMADGAAFRPGDILTSASGRTIEVTNTDAEGRLVLCDLIDYAQKYLNPSAIVDLATLTGAIIVSLGHDHAGLFSNDDRFADQIVKAGMAAGEPVWRLPLGDGYDKIIESKIADMKNSSGSEAGSITAAQFLKRYVRKDVPWAHLDIAGTAWKEKSDSPLEPVWATGYGVRLLDRLVADGFEAKAG